MNKNEIKKQIQNKVKELGEENAYKYLVIENIKVIKPQLKNIKTDEDKYMLVMLSQSITVKGIKEVGLLHLFKDLFISENVIKDEVFDYMIGDFMLIANM